MSYAQQSPPPMGSGSRTRTFEFGKTHVVRPKGKHQATIVWLHGLGDNGLSSSQLLESLRLPNIKWICPTAPIRPVKTLGGFPCTAWFDMREVSSSENGGNGDDDWEGLDASASHIANLLSTEPAHVKVGIGGFSMGGAVALYSATCYAMSSYSNGMPYPLSNLNALLALSSWLPGGGSTCRTFLLRNNNNNNNNIHANYKTRASSFPIFLAHGIADDVVLYKYGHQSAQSLYSAGFRYITFKSYEGIGHYTIPREMEELANWVTSSLGLEGIYK